MSDKVGSLCVQRIQSGQWAIVSANGEIVKICASNADAWRQFDILANEVINKQEQHWDWKFRQATANG